MTRRLLELVPQGGVVPAGGAEARAEGKSADEVGHVFAAAVRLEPQDLEGPAVLHVGGVATLYDVLVNGAVVLSDSSMFARHSVAVGEHLRVGDNEFLVRCRPLSRVLELTPRRPRARWRTMLVVESRLRWLRTTVLGRAPGFAPGPPVVGPWRPIVLETGVGPRVEALRLRTRVQDGTGALDVEVVLAEAGTVVLTLTGPHGQVSTEVVLDGGRGRACLEVPDVALWWPHTHGEPVLHDVRLWSGERALSLPGDGTGPDDVRRVGFRTLGNGSPAGRPDTACASLDVHVNGVRVFCRGAVWTPGDLAALDEALALGLNLIRVSGVTTYESDAFHARCDQLGLLVWQDLMFATFDYPLADAGFAEAVHAEVVDEAGRLVGHPSTVVVCGSAEHEQQAAMFGVRPETGAAGELAAFCRPLVEESGLDAFWVDSSPCGGSLPIRVDRGIAQYFGVGAYLRDLPDVRHAGVRFAAECLAFANLPAGAGAGAGDGPGDVDEGVPCDHGADWDFADVRRHYARRRYGAAPTLEQEQRVTGEVMAEVFGEWRRPDSGCGGGIVLWLRDLAPGAGWGLLDHRGDPKPGAGVLAAVLAPTAVWLVDEGLNGLNVHIAHDPASSVDIELTVSLSRADGSVLESASITWVMPGRGHRVLSVEGLLGRFADSSYAYRFGPPAHAGVRAVIRGDFGEREACWRVPRKNAR